MAATKEQERKALEKIKKIVEELGEDSYISFAFEGCFEIAEENITNDFACSMKQRAESAERKAQSAEQSFGFAKDELEKATRKVELCKETIERLQRENEELCKGFESSLGDTKESLKKSQENETKLWNQFREEQERAETKEQEIIQLKAKLYDLICK